MAIGKINSAETTDMTNNVTVWSVDPADSTSETFYQMDWQRWNNYYMGINAYAAIIDRKAIWTVGKGFKASKETKKRLEKIRGNGKDTFNTILHNAVKVYSIGGDFFAEIIKTKKGELINLKPLNPGSIRVISNERGTIIRYEQWDTYRGKKLVEFSPDDIFHLAWNRSADQIHGQGVTQKMEKILKMREEAMTDMQIVFHRYVKPLIISEVDTDDEAEILAYKYKLDKAVANGENMVVPKGVLEKMDRMSVPQYSTLDPIPWIKFLEAEFVKAEGVPNIVQGIDSNSSEATSKIIYLAFQQVIEWNQLFIEQQCKAQLDIEIELEFPASLEENLQEQKSKERKINNLEVGIGENT